MRAKFLSVFEAYISISLKEPSLPIRLLWNQRSVLFCLGPAFKYFLQCLFHNSPLIGILKASHFPTIQTRVQHFPWIPFHPPIPGLILPSSILNSIIPGPRSTQSIVCKQLCPPRCTLTKLECLCPPVQCHFYKSFPVQYFSTSVLYLSGFK